MLRTLGAEGFLTPSDVARLSMLACEPASNFVRSGPGTFRGSPLSRVISDAWCISVAESLGVALLTRNPELASLATACPVEVY